MRPTCTQEHVDLARWYVEGGFTEQGQVIPTTQGLSLALGVCRATPYNWATQENNPFRAAMEEVMERLQATQAVVTLNKSLTGDFNAQIAKCVLSNHNYSDKQTHEISGPNGSAIKAEWTVLPVAVKNA